MAYNQRLPPICGSPCHGSLTNVIEYRSFLNTDPPAIIDIWQKQRPMRCLSSVISRQLLDQMVLAKPYFDPTGLILAFDDGEPVGFVHASFGPDQVRGGIDYSTGVISQLRLVEDHGGDSTAHELLDRAVSYLQTRGAVTCFAGSRFPFAPFYLGLYGGSRIPGVPEEDEPMSTAMQRFGFVPGEAILIMQRSLQGYRPPINRTQMAIRRQYQVAAIVDPLLPNWWECCTFGWSEIYGFRVLRRGDQQVVGGVMLWEIQPLSNVWGRLTMGLVDLEIAQEQRQQGLATFLIGETFRHLTQQGVASVEVQIRESDQGAMRVAQKMGFEIISRGHEMQWTWQKSAGNDPNES